MKIWSYLYHPRAGLALLRISLALLLLCHGWAKISHGVGGISAMLIKNDLPGWLAYGVYLGEVLAPLLMLVGLWVVPAALTVVASMIVALALAHSGHWLQLSASGGWALELQAFYLISALVVAMTQPPGK